MRCPQLRSGGDPRKVLCRAMRNIPFGPCSSPTCAQLDTSPPVPGPTVPPWQPACWARRISQQQLMLGDRHPRSPHSSPGYEAGPITVMQTEAGRAGYKVQNLPESTPASPGSETDPGILQSGRASAEHLALADSPSRPESGTGSVHRDRDYKVR